MSLDPLVVTTLEEAYAWPTFTVTARTNWRIHLNMGYAYYWPILQPRRVTRRGQPTQCGLKWLYKSIHCQPQAEPGNTLIHTFTVPVPDGATDFSYFMTKSPACTVPDVKVPQTPPRLLHFMGIPLPLLERSSTELQSPLNPPGNSPAWDVPIAEIGPGWIPYEPPDYFVIPETGNYSVLVRFRVHLTNSAFVEAWVDLNPGPAQNLFKHVAGPYLDQLVTIETTGVLFLTAGQELTPVFNQPHVGDGSWQPAPEFHPHIKIEKLPA